MSANVAVTLCGGDKSQLHSSAYARLWLHYEFIMSLKAKQHKKKQTKEQDKRKEVLILSL